MAEQSHQPQSDPPIYKHLSPKTQAFLRVSANHRAERARLNDDTMSDEQTFIAIKPDGVQRGLIGPIISRFEARGYKLAAIKLMTASQEHLEKHYMGSGPICAMVWEGRDAVKTGRALLGATNPLASAPGTIRGDYAIDVGRNVCHGSDSVENAKKEIALWFKEGEVQSWKSAQHDWVYEKMTLANHGVAQTLNMILTGNNTFVIAYAIVCMLAHVSPVQLDVLQRRPSIKVLRFWLDYPSITLLGMAPNSKLLDIAYAEHMKNHPFGTALYTPQAYRLFHPGCVGYFDSNGSWNPIADLSSSDTMATTEYTPVVEQLERAPPETSIHWGPKISSKTKAQKVSLKVGLSAAVASAIPLDIGARYHFSSEDEGGAILLTKSPVRHEKYYYESPFKDWVRDNATLLITKRREILEHGLWIVTSTWSSEECAINVWNDAGHGVGVAFKSSAVGFGELAPSGDWFEDAQDEGWLKVKAEKGDEGRVVFFGGLRFCYRRIPFAEKLKFNKSPTLYRQKAGSGEEIETLAEIPIPADIASQDEEVFAVDCEQVLDSYIPVKEPTEDESEDDW
ncbi:hypothetical protein B7494_g4456 [Chlorociboria aeruginascens]|nr:hypothetical protein B7494_g4456 [Chlorociboria aeruginascens]